VLQTLDVLASNANVDNVEVFTTHRTGQLRRFGDSADGFLDVRNDAPHDALGFNLTGSEDFEPPVLVPPAYQRADFGGADVKGSNDLCVCCGSHNSIR
jgi:hypothetical protein